MSLRTLASPKLALAALAISIMLHAAAVSFLPHFRRPAFKPPVRIEVELAAPPPAPETPAPEEHVAMAPAPAAGSSNPLPSEKAPAPPRNLPPAKPAKKARRASEVALPVLATKGSADAKDNYTVREVPAARSSEELPMATRPGTEPSTTAAAIDPGAPAGGVGPAGGAGDEESMLQGYLRRLSQRANRHRTYPAIALRRGWQGRARVAVSFAVGGAVVGVNLDHSSGHDVLDAQAIEMVRKALSELPIEVRLTRRPLTVVVPVEFKLRLEPERESASPTG